MSGLDAHLKPPEDLRYAFKALRAKDDTSLKSYSDVFDAAIGSYAGFTESTAAKEELCMPPDLKEVLKRFFSRNEIDDMHASVATCFEHSDLPGRSTSLVSVPTSLNSMIRSICISFSCTS